MKLQIAAAMLTVIVIAAFASAQMMHDFRPPFPFPTLVVQGQGEVQAAPDQAVIRMGATVQADDAASAQDEVNRIMAAALENLRRLEIPARNIRTVGLTLSPVYEQQRADGRTRPRIIGYRAGNVVEVTLANLQRTGQVIDAGVQAGANELHGLNFQLRDDSEVRRQALRLAVQEARAKADTIAEALGVPVVGVAEISESGFVVPRQDFAMARAEMMAAPTPVQPGQITVRADVTIRYRLAIQDGPMQTPPDRRPAPAEAH